MTRGNFYFVMLYYLFLLSFPLFFSVEGSNSLASKLDILHSSNKLKLGSSSSCFGFLELCPDSASLCFPPAKPDFLTGSPEQPEADNTNPDQSVSFGLTTGGLVTCSSVKSKSTDGVHQKSFGGYNLASCQAPLIPDDWMIASNGVTTDLEETEEAETGRVDGSPSSLNVEINPPLLDWGSNSLYTASITTLTLTNSDRDTVLHVYEPYCTDPQFYPYNFDGVSIEPGENASISFVFLPRSLGLSSAQIVLQTSFSGFVIQAKGVAVESPYNIEPLMGINMHINGVLSKTLSIHNPFDETIYVEEVALWISSSESANQSNHAICQFDMSDTSPSETEWFSMGNKRTRLPRADLRPINKWEILPKNGDAIMELKLQADSEGKVFGAICMKLRNGTTQRVSTIVVPLEVHVHGNPTYSALTMSGSLSALFNCHMACDGESIFSLYLKNDGLGSLVVVNIFEETEGEKLFEIRYVKRLVIFPSSTTAIALIRRKSENVLSETSGVELQCNVVVETNYSSNALVRIPCQDFARASNAQIGGSDLGTVSERQLEEATNVKTGSFRGILEDSTQEKISPFEEVEASNLILANWLSHGKVAGSSLLTNQLVLFPHVQIGSHFSEPITVTNHGPVPSLVQLILNSEELITDCKASDNDSSECTFPTRSPKIGAVETRFGFSVADSGLMEVVLHPFESASLGPVIFHPSSRCTWSSSALIRSNVSGIEWVTLRASGGSHSISFLEGSEPVWKLEFKLDADPVNNTSSLQAEATCPSCDYRFSKEIHAKNTGELPLEIKKVRVSGTGCKSDRFTISRNCLGFNLLPGESELIGVTYRPDFSSATVQRDLELVMAGGIFVIPMKVQIPLCMVGQCRRMSVYWRVSLFFLLAATVFTVVLVFVRVMPLSPALGSSEYYLRLDNREHCAAQDDKRPFFHHSTRASRPVSKEQKKQEGPPLMSNYQICQSSPKRVDTDLISSDQLKRPATPSYSSLKPTKDPVPTPVETLQADNTNSLTIRVIREKGKRRKKRASNNNANLAAKLEVSSSHSGNSTPSSPLSPNGSTPKQAWPLLPDSDPTANPFIPSVPAEEVQMTNKTVNKPPSGSSSSSSLVFSGPHVNNSTFLAETSPIAPHARAPGPKVMKEKTTKREENEGLSTKEFTYDMWADHLSGHFIYSEGRDADYSKSFFAIQPQALPSYSGNQNKNGYNGNVTGVSGMT